MENEPTVPGFITQPAALSPRPASRRRRPWLPLLSFVIALAVVIALLYLL
ncbi:MAG: hypothetical protein ACK4J1_09360 [Hylemonella sp.]